MRFAKLAAAAAALTIVGGGAAYGTLASHAGVNPVVKYTDKSSSPSASVAGYYAQSNPGNPIGFTHVFSYLGNDGQSNQEKFSNSGGPVTNAGGVGFCDQTTSEAAQIGDTYIGGGLMNVVYDVGHLGPVPTNNGDVCENGLISTTPPVILGGVPVNDTVAVEILYDGFHAPHGCFPFQALFTAQDLSANGPRITRCMSVVPGTVFGEADAGVVADAVNLSALPTNLLTNLPGSIPLPDVAKSQFDLMDWAHVFLHGNYVDRSGEVYGSFQNSPNWNVTPVGSTSNGFAQPAGTLLIAPGKFRYDHFRMYEGLANG